LPKTKAFSLTLNSTIPCFDYLTVSSKSSAFTKVPDFTFGIRPLGPNTLASDLSPPMCSGVAIILSKLTVPSATSLSNLSSPIISTPSLFSCSWNSLSAKTATLTSLPVPAGSTHVPLTFWSP